jgi:hypothetical protein
MPPTPARHRNRQTVDAICDFYPGGPGRLVPRSTRTSVLNLINQAAEHADYVAICADTDLGGVRISSRIHDHLPDSVARTVADIGAGEHAKGSAFNPTP